MVTASFLLYTNTGTVATSLSNFFSVTEQVMTTASRSHRLIVRVQNIEASLPPLEKAVLAQTSHIHFAYTSGLLMQVEHIIREENMMAAQEIIELFCELIAVRLPIIEAQRYSSFVCLFEFTLHH
ncbi:uncharacterized protein LOC110266008 isoform X2 [Arachis ipaensis]|uniref:uncharacterized protein LOC110266008 isoform X2 n=1 Tax=Arachis ipaensis TaxID=130454 RepID=UPI000A2B488C|nr:uncharacterized protein LOC110266008 isoform X2 [Arachis ipaensis]